MKKVTKKSIAIVVSRYKEALMALKEWNDVVESNETYKAWLEELPDRISENVLTLQPLRQQYTQEVKKLSKPLDDYAVRWDGRKKNKQAQKAQEILQAITRTENYIEDMKAELQNKEVNLSNRMRDEQTARENYESLAGVALSTLLNLAKDSNYPHPVTGIEDTPQVLEHAQNLCRIEQTANKPTQVSIQPCLAVKDFLNEIKPLKNGDYLAFPNGAIEASWFKEFLATHETVTLKPQGSTLLVVEHVQGLTSKAIIKLIPDLAFGDYNHLCEIIWA